MLEMLTIAPERPARASWRAKTRMPFATPTASPFLAWFACGPRTGYYACSVAWERSPWASASRAACLVQPIASLRFVPSSASMSNP